MTPKQHVLKEYPEAKCTKRWFSDYEYCYEIRNVNYMFMGDGSSPIAAWKEAWRIIQQRVIWVLEGGHDDF